MSYKISVIHPTARLPHGWTEVFGRLVDNADDPGSIEYLMGIDTASVPSIPATYLTRARKLGKFGWVINSGRHCVVDAINACASSSTGQIMFNMQDDIFVPPHWDTELLHALAGNDPEIWPMVVHVSSIKERDDRIFSPQIMTRKRYVDCGYFYWPEYLSMYADDEFTKAARLDEQDGTCSIIDATHLYFEERHPAYGTAQDDEVYQHENSPQSYALGKRVFESRKAAGFPKQDWVTPKRSSIMVCMPGEHFGMEYLANWTQLFVHLNRTFDVRCRWSYHTDVYECRNMFSRMPAIEGDTDLVLWMDDDNILSPENFDKLYDALEKEALDLCAGWCWIYDRVKRQYRTSGGLLSEGSDGKVLCHSLDPKTFHGQVEPINYTGFPVVLHRGDVWGKVGIDPFEKIPNVPGEDVAFCVRMGNVGLKLGLHTGVKVPHLKTVNLDPDIDKLKEE